MESMVASSEFSVRNNSFIAALIRQQFAAFMKMFDLSGEVAVVIGGTGVLGGALAEGLAEAGASVAVVGRNEERGQASAKAIKAKGGKAAFFSADAVSRCNLTEAHEKIEAALGAPAILLNA